MADAIALACQELFPTKAGYRVDEDRLQGIIRGRRYRVSRHGFVGQVSVQLFATAGSYRSADPSSLRMRVDGRARLETPVAGPRPPIVGLALATLALWMAYTVLVSAGRGWWAVTRNPSWSWAIDGIGLLGAGMMAVASVWIGVAVLRAAAALPWARFASWWRRNRVDHAVDRRRWTALHGYLEALLPGHRVTP